MTQNVANTSQPSQRDNPILGIGYAILAYLLLATMQAFGKLLSENHTAIEISFYRNVIALVPLLAFILLSSNGSDVLKINKNPNGVFGRSVLGTLSLVFTFAAFSLMPMADVTAILFMSALVVPVLGLIFLREAVSPNRWVVVFIGFVGVLVTVQPSGYVNGSGVLFAFGAALMQATMVVVLRHLGKTEMPLTVTFYFLLVGAILTAIPMPFIATVPAADELPLLLGVGISGLLAQLALAMAFKFAAVGIVSVISYSAIVWATLFGWYIWDDWPALPVWVGGAIVISCNVYIVWREHQNDMLPQR